MKRNRLAWVLGGAVLALLLAVVLNLGETATILPTMSARHGVARAEVLDLGFDFFKGDGHWSITDFNADGTVMMSFEVPYATNRGYLVLVYGLSALVGAGLGVVGRSLWLRGQPTAVSIG